MSEHSSSTQAQVQLREVPARRGLDWLAQGCRVFFLQPLGFASLLGLYLLAMLLLSALPQLGPLLFLCSVPLLSLGFMLATQRTLGGQAPSPKVFIEPFQMSRDRTQALLLLGVVYAISFSLLVVFCNWLDDGKLDLLLNAMSNQQLTREDVVTHMNDAQLRQGLLWRLLLTMLVSLPFWHAPALIHWGGQSVWKSLFFSMVGLWNSKAAFLAYSAAGIAAIFGLILGCAVILGALDQAHWIRLIVLPAMLVFANVFYVSLFFAFADSFSVSALKAPPP